MSGAAGGGAAGGGAAGGDAPTSEELFADEGDAGAAGGGGKGEAASPSPAASPAGAGSGGAGDLVLEGEVACNLLSDHGGELVILDDGRVVFMNASAHLVELAFAIDPENEDVKTRMAKIEETRRAREGGA